MSDPSRENATPERDPVIDESAGEQWFGTEAEARAAGWRAPKNAR